MPISRISRGWSTAALILIFLLGSTGALAATVTGTVTEAGGVRHLQRSLHPRRRSRSDPGHDGRRYRLQPHPCLRILFDRTDPRPLRAVQPDLPEFPLPGVGQPLSVRRPERAGRPLRFRDLDGVPAVQAPHVKLLVVEVGHAGPVGRDSQPAMGITKVRFPIDRNGELPGHRGVGDGSIPGDQFTGKEKAVFRYD